MIIEALTAYSVVQVTWEMLEILHLLHVGHETGVHGYKAVNVVTNAFQQQLQKNEYKKDPLLKVVHEAKTDYDFQATDNVDETIKTQDKAAQDYFDRLNKSLGILNHAKKYFLDAQVNLEGLVNVLGAEVKNEENFLSNLSTFQSNFQSFSDAFKQFSLHMTPPDRKKLYILSILEGKSSIEKFNAYLEIIDQSFNELKETQEKIANLFQKNLSKIQASLAEASSSSALSFEELNQRISDCLAQPELIEKTMHNILPKNLQIARVCTEIVKISTVFKRRDNLENEQTNLWSNNPNWFPLLTEEKQIEAGQRIFLHAMNETYYPGNIKLQIAKIFLRQYVSEDDLKQVTIELLSKRLANLLIAEQIKKCEKMIGFLNNLTEENILPEQDLYGLLEWLKIKRKIVNSVEYWREILVSPFNLSRYNIESLRPKLETLLPDENIDLMMKAYQASYWGAIREKSDQLIHLPVSFKTKIIPDDRSQTDKQFVEDSNLVTPLMSKLSNLLITELTALKEELYEKKIRLEEDILILREEEKTVRNGIKNREHENGVERIKESHRYISSIDERSNKLFPYLYRPETVNETEKKRQVPTVDDLFQVIYRGVDLHEVCKCKCKGNPNSNSNLLLDYFYPKHPTDPIMEAFVYALQKCQINARNLLHLFSYPPEPSLAIGNGEAKNPSLVIILKNSKKIDFPVHSIALNNISPEVKEETEIFSNQLDNYYNLSVMRLNPKLRKELPLVEKFKLLIQDLFKLGQRIREERFESVQIIMGSLHAVVSSEDIMSINKAIDDFKKNYDNRYKIAQKTDRSTLYAFTKKAMNGCISKMRCLSEVEQKQLELEIQKATIESLQESVHVLKQEKEVIEDELQKSKTQREQDKEAFEAQRARDKEEAEAQRARDKAELEAKFKEIEAKVSQFFTPVTQPALDSRSAIASNEESPESSHNTRFFKP